MSYHQAFINNDISNLEKYFNEITNHEFYIDIAVEEGKKDIVNFYLNKGIKPSLYASQMARINGHFSTVFLIEQFPQPIYRNMVNIQQVHSYYDINLKQIIYDNMIKKYI